MSDILAQFQQGDAAIKLSCIHSYKEKLSSETRDFLPLLPQFLSSLPAFSDEISRIALLDLIGTFKCIDDIPNNEQSSSKDSLPYGNLVITSVVQTLAACIVDQNVQVVKRAISACSRAYPMLFKYM